MDPAETLGRQPLPEQHLATRVSNQVEDDASNSRSRCGQDHVEEEFGRLLVDVTSHDRIHGESEECCVYGGNHEYAPRA